MARAFRSGRLTDGSFLFLIVALSFAPYLASLGFYSDDWPFMATLAHCNNQSIWGLSNCFWTETVGARFRPLQILELTLLYKTFGLQPLGYHVVNSLVFALSVILFYLVLRELSFSRLISVAVPLIYSLLPAYSTDRFWIAAYQANLSMAFCFLSFYAAAKASACQTPRAWVWLATSAICLAASLLAYEVAIFIFLLLPLLLYSRMAGNRTRSRVFIVVSLGAWLLTLALKYPLQTRIRFGGQFEFLKKLPSLAGNGILNFIDFNFGKMGLGLPSLSWRWLRDQPSPFLIFATVAVWILTLLYLYSLANKAETVPRRLIVWLLTIGAAIYWLSFALFVGAGQFSNTGVDNRICIAAAIETAAVIVGALALATSFISRPSLRAGLLSFTLSVYCASGFLAIETLAGFWGKASQQQRDLLVQLRNDIPLLPHGSTLLLDGTCPYVGPGIVFEGWWDVSGALGLLYLDPSLQGDVVTSKVRILPDRLETSIYEEAKAYSYGANLLVYHSGRRQVCRIADSVTAQNCLRAGNMDPRRCSGTEGKGVPVF